MPVDWDEFEPVTSNASPVDWSEYEPAEPDPAEIERQRRRVSMLGEMAALERERGPSDQLREMLEWTDRPISPRDLAQGLAVVGVPGMARVSGMIPEDLATADLAKAGLAIGSQLPPGVRDSVANTAAGMVTPMNVALAAAGGAAPGVVGRGIAGGFGVDMARHVPEVATQLGEAYGVAESPSERQRIITDLATQIVMPAAALGAAIPPRVGTPPRIPGVMSAEEAAANRAAVNNMAPGTVRPNEINAWAPPEINLEAPRFTPPGTVPEMFHMGEVPFDAARRFGTMKLPPVEVLPQRGRLPDVQILDKPTPLDRETPGQPLHFWSEAPIIRRKTVQPEIQVAIVEGEALGLTKSAEAAAQVAEGSNRLAPYREPKPFTAERAAVQEKQAAKASVEEGLHAPMPPMEALPPDQFPAPPGMPEGTLSNLQRERVQAGKENVRIMQSNTPPSSIPTEGFKSMEDAFEAGYQRRTPEGIAELEAFKARNQQEKQAARDRKDIDAFAQLAQKGSKIDEALSMAKGEIGDRKIAQEWLQAREGKAAATSVQAIAEMAPDAGTAHAQQLGKALPKERVGELAAAVKQAEADAARIMAEADANPTLENLDAMSKAGTKAGLMKESLEAAVDLHEAKLDPQFMGPEGQAAFNKLMEERVAAASEAAESAAKPTDLVSKLESLKFGAQSGKLFTLSHPEVFSRVGKQLWDDSLDLAIGAVKAGRAIADAVELAIQHLRKNVRDLPEIEAAIRKQFESIVAQETKAGKPPVGGTPPAAPAPARGAGAPPVIPPAPGGPRPAPAAPGAPPPATPPGSPPAAPGAVPGPVTLDDIYQRFELDPKVRRPIGEVIGDAVEAFRTGFSSQFRPLNKLAEDVAKAYGGAKRDVAGIFEQLKGSSGKAEADVYRFDQAVSKLVKGDEKDFNAYMMLRRSIDRLEQDARDLAAAAAGAPVKKLNRRSVSTYLIPELQAKLAMLETKLGSKLPNFEKAADAFQQQMDQALQLQVTSGRMPLKVYEQIKDGNQFYAPFKIMKYVEESQRPEGSGRNIDTLADYTKAMEGVEDPNFKLGDMQAAARHSIVMSRILAEKNLAMREITELANMDTAGAMVKKLATGQDAPKGMDVVNVLENGKQVRYAVDQTVADAINMMGPQSGGLVARIAAGIFRAGATTFNIPFQVGNLLADMPRAALVSKYGINGVRDLYQFPMDVVHSIYSSMAGNVFGAKNQLFQDFLDSGAAGTTIQKYLTPEALEFKPQAAAGGVLKSTLNTVAHFADAIEQSSKVLGIKRAMREEGATSGAQLARDIPAAVTEVRRFSGSPDFGRMGKWVDQYRLNLLYMFLNARIQGTVADVGRLLGRDGKGTAAKTWGRVGIPVGTATALAYYLNHRPEYAEDFAKRSEQEKRNYWLIPKDSFITGPNGEKMRDYWRIPKREISKWTANIVESGLDFARDRNPQTIMDWGQTMVEELSPVNIQGNTAQERLESVGASLNPAIKAPLEAATGRDMYRHKPIVPDTQKKASPELQFTDRTPEVFKQLAEAMPDLTPEMLRSPLMLENMTKNFTAGLFTQFLPRKPVEGRNAVENTPLLQRFQAIPFSDDTEFRKQIESLERESADDQLTRYRQAQKLIQDNKDATPQVLMQKLIEQHGKDAKLAERVVDLYTAQKNGITAQERRVLALPTAQRAEWVIGSLKNLDPAAKQAAIRDMARKRILTKRVAEEMTKLSASQ